MQDLADEIRRHKSELLSMLWSQGWPSECLDAVQRFGQPHSRLYPLLGKRVCTPSGPGLLVQVLSPHAGVVLDTDPRKTSFFLWEEIRPIADATLRSAESGGTPGLIEPNEQ